jgi:hypothetical protein
MTGNAINAKGEAPELHELSSEELDAVSGGSMAALIAQAKQNVENAQQDRDNKKQAGALKGFQQMINDIL